MFGPLGSGAIGANNLDIRESSAGSLGITAAVAYDAILNFDSATGNITVGASTTTSASLTELSLGQILLSAQDTFAMRYVRESSGEATITAAALYNSIVAYASSSSTIAVGASTVSSATAAALSAGTLALLGSTAGSAVLNRSSTGSLDIRSTTSFQFLPQGQGVFNVDSAGELYLSAISTFSAGYVRSSQGELEVDAQTVVSRTVARASNISLELLGSTQVETRIYTNVAFDSLVELVIAVNEQPGTHGARPGALSRKRPSRQIAFLSHVHMGRMRPHTESVEHVPGRDLPAAQAEQTPPKRPLGELGRFLQEFGQRKVDYSFDSQTGTVSFWISTETEVSNPRTERARAEQLDEEDQLLLGLSENYLALDGDLTQRMRAAHSHRLEIEHQDLDLLGLGEFN